MTWLGRIKKLWGVILTLTSIVGLVGFPRDVATLGGLVAPLGGRIGWIVLLFVGLALLLGPWALENVRPTPSHDRATSSPSHASSDATERLARKLAQTPKARANRPIASAGAAFPVDLSELQATLNGLDKSWRHSHANALSRVRKEGNELRDHVLPPESSDPGFVTAHITRQVDLPRREREARAWSKKAETALGDTGQDWFLWTFERAGSLPKPMMLATLSSVSANALAAYLDRRLGALDRIIEALVDGRIK